MSTDYSFTSDSSVRLCQLPAVNPDDWFAWPGSPRAVNATKLCLACPFANDCAMQALVEGIPEGIWGGMNGEDRQSVWAVMGGRPSGFLDALDAAIGPMLQARRDHESFDAIMEATA